MIEFVESKGFRSVEDHVVCRKLFDAGVEIILVFPTKIAFVWDEHMCYYKNGTFYCELEFVWDEDMRSYKNGTFYSGTKRDKSCDNIYKLDHNFLNELIGKLTDEQLERLSNVIDLYEDEINYIESQVEKMKYDSMYGTELYHIKEGKYRYYTELVAMLRTAFQTRDFEHVQYGYNEKKYVLNGE